MDLIKNILFFVVLTGIVCAIMLFEICSERRRFFEPAPSSPRLHQSWTRARLAESVRRRSPYLGARLLPLRFHAVNASRIRWEILRACIFWMTAALWCSAVLELMRN